MRALIGFLLICFVFDVEVQAQEAVISLEGKSYALQFGNPPRLVQGSNRIKGVLQEKMGIFSHWSFPVNPKTNTGFEVILNDQAKKIISLKEDMNAGGPFLLAVSPGSEYVVFDYGTGPGERGFEMRDSSGKKLFEDDYWGDDIQFIPGGILYEKSAKEKIPSGTVGQADGKKCSDSGMEAVKIEKFEYTVASHISRKRSDFSFHIECAD